MKNGHDAPFNSKNRLMTAGDLEELLSRYVDVPRDSRMGLDIYRRALVHRSYCKRKNETVSMGNAACPANCIPLQEEPNERLEFLGDSVIGLAVAAYLFERYPGQNEGFLTQLRTKLVNGAKLAELAKVVGLDRWVILSKHIEDANGRGNAKVLEDCFEAFVGAMFLDAGFDFVSQWFIGLIESQINFADLVCSTHSHKDTLIKYFQHAFNLVPKFVDVDGGGPTHAVSVVDPASGTVLAIGSGPNRRTAENDAARQAMCLLKVGPLH